MATRMVVESRPGFNRVLAADPRSLGGLAGWFRRLQRRCKMKLASRFLAASVSGVIVCAILARTGFPKMGMSLGESRVPVAAARGADGAQISVSWDAKGAVAVRKFGLTTVKSDEGLEGLLEYARENAEKAKKPDAVVSIDATGDVPWKDLTNVISICRKARWKKIEFVVP